ncbi:unnamed protein product [Discosporangium mesarthrocarpum]
MGGGDAAQDKATAVEFGAVNDSTEKLDTATVVWNEIMRLRDDIPSPGEDGVYGDGRACAAFQTADRAVASLCAVPREEMLEGFTKLVEGERLPDLLNTLVGSADHPALQHACLMVMCGVSGLRPTHDVILGRPDVLKTLFAALASPKQHRISPPGAEEELDVNPATGAVICLNSLLVSCGGLRTPGDTKIWEELDAMSAIASALEAHTIFQGGGDEDVLPAMLFGLATPLLLGRNPDNPGEDQMRLARAFLTLLADRREWVARSLSMAASASREDTTGTSGQAAPVPVNNLLINSLAHPNLLGRVSIMAPVRLRARAIAAARQCESDGRFASGFAEHLTQALGLGGHKKAGRSAR